MILTHKIELQPTHKQAEFFSQCAGAARFFWNRALDQWQTRYESGVKTSEAELRKEIAADRKINAEIAWSNDLPAASISNSIRNLGLAFQAFFRRVKSGDKPGYPKFKSRHKSKPSFEPWDGGRISVKAKKIRIPNLGFVRMREMLRFSGKIVKGVVYQEGGRWFVSISVETEHAKPRTGDADIGIDLGCKEMAVCSDGQRFEGAKPLRRLAVKLARESRSLAKKVKGSANRAKAKLKLQRIHSRISNIRKDYIHQMTTSIVLANARIAIEDLAVDAMRSGLRLGKSVSDNALAEVRRQLDYKSKLYGSRLFIVDRWFPSSKTCSKCGHVKKDLTLSDRQYECAECGMVTCRDLNASINLMKQIPVLDRELTLLEMVQ